MKSKLTIITQNTAKALLETGYENGIYSPKGLFLAKEEDVFVAIDNQHGDAWTEDFRSIEAAIGYLFGQFASDEMTEMTEHGRSLIQRFKDGRFICEGMAEALEM